MTEAPSATLWREFGQWIRERRNELRLTQEKAGKLAEIDRQQWYRIESGQSGSRRDTVIRIAHALKLPEEDVLRRAGFSPGGEESTEGLFRGLQRLTPEQQKLVKRQIRALIDSVAEEESPDTDYID